jgi:GntR family transcriptional regulator
MACTPAPALPLPGGRAPLYSRLRQAIRDRVTSGEWRPGEQIPTIRELGEAYGVSRITVVQALDTLAREGVLVRWQGKGVFVGEHRFEEPRLPLLSFTEAILVRGQTPDSRTLSVRREPPSPALNARLSLRRDENVVLVERLRLVDSAPFGLEHAYLPEHLVPGLVDRADPIDSLYRLLADLYGVLPTTASETYFPIVLDFDQARALEALPGSPALHLERTTSDQHGRAIAYATTVIRGDRFKLRLQLRR